MVPIQVTNDLMKTLLAEEGLLEENLSKRVKKNDAALREMMKRNKRMQKALADVSEHLGRGTQISGTDKVALPQRSYAFLTDTFKKLDADIKADSSVQESTAVLLSEADAQLKAIGRIAWPKKSAEKPVVCGKWSRTSSFVLLFLMIRIC